MDGRGFNTRREFRWRLSRYLEQVSAIWLEYLENLGLMVEKEKDNE